MSAKWHDLGNAIPAGGTLTIAGDPNAHGYAIWNTDATHPLTVKVGNTTLPPLAAGAGPIVLPPSGADAKWCPADDITLTGTAAASFAAAKW